MNRQFQTTAFLTVTLLLLGSASSAMDDRSAHPRLGNPMPAVSAAAAHFGQPASWDIYISVGKREGHRLYGHGHGRLRSYRHGHRHDGYPTSPYYPYGCCRRPYYDYRDQGHPDYGYRSYGYRSNRYDSDGNYHYKGGRYRYWYPYGRGHGYGYGYRHRY